MNNEDIPKIAPKPTTTTVAGVPRMRSVGPSQLEGSAKVRGVRVTFKGLAAHAEVKPARAGVLPTSGSASMFCSMMKVNKHCSQL